MKCPICNVDLMMSERQGIEIDYCPTCRGVWLDRGELDKLIERSTSQSAPRPAESYPQTRHHDGGKPYHKKKQGFLGELFDFD